MHAKRFPVDDLELIAEQRHRSSYSSGSSSESTSHGIQVMSEACVHTNPSDLDNSGCFRINLVLHSTVGLVTASEYVKAS